MKTVTLHNKKFEIFISDTEIASIVNSIANQINSSNIEAPLFIAVMNGSFLFAADLMRNITIPNTEISFIKLSSYIGTKTSGEVKQLIGINNNIVGRNVIILEDIVDTGITINNIINLLNKEKVNDIKIATLLFKPHAYKESHTIDYIGKSIANDFVLGYGLDYNELGRNLKNIYKLKN
ncbi:phosphoribosyltransferase family protein [Flavobacteriales bacterium]|jgi:hypoxanthine phosphoribosyltransferase|nr:phosphoribosyltransferase family protein [Flavobacteriales bacterium]|tara:strand:- start:312 stop:848 length:537 start_codon:yes stop_codon:yes gene_type:complete